MHKKAYAHCDVKPDNILLEVNRSTVLLEPRWTDFGISRLVDDSQAQVKSFDLSKVNGVSISYASPESVFRFRTRNQSQGHPLEWFSNDVYSFGIQILEMLKRRDIWSDKR